MSASSDKEIFEAKATAGVGPYQHTTHADDRLQQLGYKPEVKQATAD